MLSPAATERVNSGQLMKIIVCVLMNTGILYHSTAVEARGTTFHLVLDRVECSPLYISAGPRAPADPPVSTSHRAVGVLGLQMRSTVDLWGF